MERLHLTRDQVRDLPAWFVQRAQVFWSVQHEVDEAKSKAKSKQSASKPRPHVRRGSRRR